MHHKLAFVLSLYLAVQFVSSQIQILTNNLLPGSSLTVNPAQLNTLVNDINNLFPGLALNITTSSNMNNLTNSPVNSSSYVLATTAFGILQQRNLNCCVNGCMKLNKIALKQYSTQYYLTSNTYYLSLIQNTSPIKHQLYDAEQNIDCTWSFKSNEGLYLSIDTSLAYLSLSLTLRSSERFYLERRNNWIYIQSANTAHNYVTVNDGIAFYGLNQASRFIMELWPNLDIGWN